jgi:hypothetical protein
VLTTAAASSIRLRKSRVSVQRLPEVALGSSCSCDGALRVKLAKPFLASTNKCLAQGNKSPDCNGDKALMRFSPLTSVRVTNAKGCALAPL